MEKEKTAVEWLIDEIENIPFQCPDVTDYYNDVIALFDQAKEMENEQIIEAWYNGSSDGATVCTQHSDLPAEQYYESKYGKDENKAENNN